MQTLLPKLLESLILQLKLISWTLKFIPHSADYLIDWDLPMPIKCKWRKSDEIKQTAH